MSCCLKNYAKKTVVLTPQRPQGAIAPLTPLTFELAKLELDDISLFPNLTKFQSSLVTATAFYHAKTALTLKKSCVSQEKNRGFSFLFVLSKK